MEYTVYIKPHVNNEILVQAINKIGNKSFEAHVFVPKDGVKQALIALANSMYRHYKKEL